MSQNNLHFDSTSKEDINPNEYSWVLTRFIRTLDGNLAGQAKEPVSEISPEVNTELVIANLMKDKIFDFEYQREEGDCLKIYYKNNYLAVLYEEHEWKEGYHPQFSTITKIVAKGIMHLKY